MSFEDKSEYSYSNNLQDAFLTTCNLNNSFIIAIQENEPQQQQQPSSCATSYASHSSIIGSDDEHERESGFGSSREFICRKVSVSDLTTVSDTDSEVSSDDDVRLSLPDDSCYDVTIIGAGLSALSALRELLLHDKSLRIQILEAREYMGGRILTGEEKVINGHVVQLAVGAAWIHGDRGNPLLMLGKDMLEMKPVSARNPWMLPSDASAVTVCVDGCEMDMHNSHELWASFISKVERDPLLGTLNLAEAIAKHLTLSEQSSPLVLRNVALCECWSGASSTSLPADCLIGSSAGFTDSATNSKIASADGSLLYGDFPGHHCLMNNTADIIDDICCDIGGKHAVEKMVRLNAPVAEVALRRGHSAVVTTVDGRSFSSNHVIITAPLKPLKKIHFEPPLPAEKSAAMNRISYCCYKKVQIEFSSPFWSCKDPFLVLINSDRQKATLGPSLLLDNFLYLRGVPILEAVVVGKYGQALVGKPDVEIQRIIIDAISDHFAVTEVVDCVVSRWEEDIYSTGAYSFHGTSYRSGDVEIIREPVAYSRGCAPQIFFAGEHTDPVIYGSLNAAYSSGVRVAGEVLSAMKGE